MIEPHTKAKIVIHSLMLLCTVFGYKVPTHFAGGALRDIQYGSNQDIKDIDIWVPSRCSVEDTIAAFSSIGIRLTEDRDDESGYEERAAEGRIKFVLDGEYLGYAVNVICLNGTNTLFDVLSKFDLNINQHWMRGDGEIIGGYQRDVKVLDSADRGSPPLWYARVSRIQAKLPHLNWGTVIEDAKAELEVPELESPWAN